MINKFETVVKSITKSVIIYEVRIFMMKYLIQKIFFKYMIILTGL